MVYSTIATKEPIGIHFEEEEYLISAGRIAKVLRLDSYEWDKRSLLALKRKSDFGMQKTDLLYHYGKAGLFCPLAGCNKFEPSIIKSKF